MCSRVDLPAPEGPTSATISPPATLKEASCSTSRLLRAWRKTRRTPRSSRPWPLRLPTLLRSLIAPLLIAERLDRIEPRGPPGGIERRQEGQRQGDPHDEGDLERVDLGRHADRQSTSLNSSH